MNNKYKLNQEIVQFIVNQKKTSPSISCRSFVVLIEQKFSIKLSKSLINNVIKENNLSSPIGRRQIKAKEEIASGTSCPRNDTGGGPIEALPRVELLPVILPQPVEQQIIRGKDEFIKDGGLIFLKAADLKLSLSSRLFGQEMSLDSLILSCWELDKTSPQVKDYILQLNSYVQNNFFPPVYGVLDFRAMQERFYSLPAKVQNLPKMLKVQLFLPPKFPWIKDIVWQEDLSYAINKVNKAAILTKEGGQIILTPGLLPAR